MRCLPLHDTLARIERCITRLLAHHRMDEAGLLAILADDLLCYIRYVANPAAVDGFGGPIERVHRLDGVVARKEARYE